MKRVEQLEDNGCFVAAAASVLGFGYWKARRKLVGKAYDDPALTVDLAMSKLARLLGKTPRPTRKRRIRNMKRKTMILLTWSDGRGHTILWDGKRVIDPAKQYPWALHSYEKHLYKAYSL